MVIGVIEPGYFWAKGQDLPLSHQQLVIGVRGPGYFLFFALNLICHKRYRLSVHQEGVITFCSHKSEMSQERWDIDASRRGYFLSFTLNLKCPNRYGLLVLQEGVIFCCSPKI